MESEVIVKDEVRDVDEFGIVAFKLFEEAPACPVPEDELVPTLDEAKAVAEEDEEEDDEEEDIVDVEARVEENDDEARIEEDDDEARDVELEEAELLAQENTDAVDEEEEEEEGAGGTVMTMT